MFDSRYEKHVGYGERAGIPCDAKNDNYIFNHVYDELFGSHTDRDQHSNCHYYNQLVPDYYSKDAKASFIERLNRYFDECVKIASMDRDKFIDSVCERFERDKKGFESWRTREVFDLLQALPEKTIRGYLDLKES